MRVLKLISTHPRKSLEKTNKRWIGSCGTANNLWQLHNTSELTFSISKFLKAGRRNRGGGARKPNLNVAFTNACASVVEILSLSPRMHGMQRMLYSLTRIMRNIWTLDHVKVMHSSCADQSKSSVSTWIRPFFSFCPVVCHFPAVFRLNRELQLFVLTSIAERQNCFPLSWQAHSVRSRSLIS